MDTQNVQQEEAESDTVTYLRCGVISILEALSVKLPDVFAAEILPKLDVHDTLSLAQVNKAYNAAVWSADGVRSLEAKIKAHFGEQGRIVEPLYWAAKHGNVPAVRALLESGEDVNKVLKRDKRTALHVAAHFGHAAWRARDAGDEDTHAARRSERGSPRASRRIAAHPSRTLATAHAISHSRSARIPK